MIAVVYMLQSTSEYGSISLKDLFQRGSIVYDFSKNKRNFELINRGKFFSINGVKAYGFNVDSSLRQIVNKGDIVICNTSQGCKFGLVIEMSGDNITYEQSIIGIVYARSYFDKLISLNNTLNKFKSKYNLTDSEFQCMINSYGR